MWVTKILLSTGAVKRLFRYFWTGSLRKRCPLRYFVVRGLIWHFCASQIYWQGHVYSRMEMRNKVFHAPMTALNYIGALWKKSTVYLLWCERNNDFRSNFVNNVFAKTVNKENFMHNKVWSHFAAIWWIRAAKLVYSAGPIVGRVNCVSFRKWLSGRFFCGIWDPKPLLTVPPTWMKLSHINYFLNRLIRLNVNLLYQNMEREETFGRPFSDYSCFKFSCSIWSTKSWMVYSKSTALRLQKSVLPIFSCGSEIS